MDKPYKILVAGVGGQGVVFLTNLIVKSALIAELPVATSEIHGLAQRGGSVTAGVTIGENTFGFLEKAGVDLLIGLEPLEAQRSASYLNKNSSAIIDDNRILPYAVNSGNASYPDTSKFVDYLKNKIRNCVSIPENIEGVNTKQRNIYALGIACAATNFPIPPVAIEKAITETAKDELKEKSLEVFRKGLNKQEIILTNE